MFPAKKSLIIAFAIVLMPGLLGFSPQEARVNHKKIEREQAKKKKQAIKDYEKAVRRHNKMQSKSTRSSMKQTKKESKKVTPSIR